MNKKRSIMKMRYSVLFFLMLIIMVGSAVGSYAELKIDTDFRNSAMEYIDKVVAHEDSVDKLSVFKESFKNNGKLMLIIAAGGLTVILFPAAVAIALYKGISIGFTSALILEGNGKAGIINCCSSLLIHNCIFIAMIIIYAYFTTCMAIDIIKCRNKRKKRELYFEKMKTYFLISAGAFLMLIMGAVTEAYLNPIITGLI